MRGAIPNPAAWAIRLVQVTIAYNFLEGIVAVGFGIEANSIALMGFGLDSWVEVMAAIVVLHRLRADTLGGSVYEAGERRALRFVAITFWLLAAYLLAEGARDVALSAVPEVSRGGIALTALSMMAMPLLATLKRRAGEEMGSRLVVAEAAETRLCAWLSVSTFGGLAGYALFGWTWLDPASAFVIAAFAVSEGREAWEGDLDEGCSDD